MSKGLRTHFDAEPVAHSMKSVSILADTPGDAELLRRAVGERGREFRSTSELLEGSLDTDCLVFGFRGLNLPRQVERLRKVQRRLPWIPLVLVTERSAAVARLLCKVQVAELVWYDNVGTELQTRVEAVRRASALNDLADKVRRSVDPPALRAALVYSLRRSTEKPVRNVQELGTATGRSPVTLFQQFRARAGGATSFSRFLSALVVLRARQLRNTGMTWEEVSGYVGFDRGTLTRKSKRWLGRTLTELDHLPPRSVPRGVCFGTPRAAAGRALAAAGT